ncbi:response regulator [Caenimonas sedimenti]|uniref:histidine kinase n=1 Tax=Caenimonas sedimenti TaxID=2596921 RepID=A0A562ZNN1_9BURK|nr:response regulator [Caenimonas sedimenti]
MSALPAHVLLVDDQPANLLALEAVLDSLGVNLVRAMSGTEALAHVEQQDFAAVLLDVRMPGMDGFEVAREIRRRPRSQSTPILFVTAGDDPDEAMKSAYALGAVDFLAKPLRSEVIKAKVGVFVDLYRSKEELRASRDERLRLATEASGLGVWVWEPDGDQVTWEHSWLADMMGISRSEPPPNAERFRNEFIHLDDREEFRDAARNTLRTGAPFFFQGRIHRKSDGALRWLELRGRLQPAYGARPRQVIGTAMDITEQKLFQQRLQANEERYRTLFESIDEGFCLIQMLRDPRGVAHDYRFLEANEAFSMHTGLRDVVGRTICELVPGHETHWFEIYDKVARGGEAVRFVEEAKAMGRWFDVYAARLGGPGSDRVAVLFTDITARLKAEQDLRRLADELAQADRHKTEFLATLAHELRNPLAPLSNGLHLMRLSAGKAEVVERTRQMMERQVQHMVHLVDDLLDVARISTGKVELRRERVDLKDVVATAVETSASLIEAGQHRLTVTLPEEAMAMDADPTRLAQVVSNLLNNAAKYTPTGGAISLTVRHAGEQAELTVTDTGIGIPAEAITQVFQMFAQVGRAPGQGGLGIGLSLVRSLVELHGGSVAVASPGSGLGSSFTVRLPLLETGVATGAARPASARPAGEARNLRVLVVDDNVDAAESLGVLLELEGHATRIAHDGTQGLALAREMEPDIVFLDIGLPDLSGYEVAQRMRALPALHRTFLVALTGWGTKEDRARSRESGFDRHLTKPAGLAAVEQLLREAADRQAAPSQQLESDPN